MAKILYICEYGTLNGGEQSLLATLPFISAEHEVVFLAPAEGAFPQALREVGYGTTAWEAESEWTSNRPKSLPQRRAGLRRIIRKIAPDIIHANSLSMSRLAGPVARELQLPSIGHLRDILRVSTRAMGDINANSHLIAVSQATLDWHVAQGLNAAQAEVLYNGVDLEKFRRQPADGKLHGQLQLAESIRFVTAIGQIGLRKGTDLFLEAAAAISIQQPDVHFLIAGERNSGKPEAVALEQRLHSIAGKSPLQGRVHFLGYRRDVAHLLNETTLLVHAARQEPLGRVLLEAAATGTPILSTDVGGTREILGPDVTLVPPGDAATLGAAMSTVLRNIEGAEITATAARRRMEETFDIRKSAARLLARYAQLYAPQAIDRKR